MIALVAALWAYDGWSDVATMAGEVERPQRSMPLALVGGVAIVGALYMLTNAAIQYVLPAVAIAAADRPAADAMRVVAGQWGATLVSIGMAVSICATFVGSSLSGFVVPVRRRSRRAIFQLAACQYAVSKTPSNAPFSAVLTKHSCSRSEDSRRFSLAIFSEWLFYSITASNIFVFCNATAARTARTASGISCVSALLILPGGPSGALQISREIAG
jgi:APA family basic amino acid/polyamine antiporter